MNRQKKTTRYINVQMINRNVKLLGEMGVYKRKYINNPKIKS